MVLSVAEHPYFERQEDDLHIALNISFVQAALGDELEVPTLEGDHKLKIAAGIESGEVLTLKNKGIAHLRGGGRGDIHVHVQVTTPKKLSSEQKKLLKRLDETLKESGESKNLFDKVKDALS